ncbi:MAG TPA: hypothetical protein VGK63_02385, partial [Candidatus Limnocylindrales bacterium]
DYAAANAVGIVAPIAGAVLADGAGLAIALTVGGLIGLVGLGLFAVEPPAMARRRRTASSPVAA